MSPSSDAITDERRRRTYEKQTVDPRCCRSIRGIRQAGVGPGAGCANTFAGRPQSDGWREPEIDPVFRQHRIWLTPHGCLKAALAPGANPIAVTRNEQGKGRIRAVSFMALGKYRVQCAINDRNLVERIQTWFDSPVVGDLYYELVLTNYKDFVGVMFPTTFHAHHDLDDDLEGEEVNLSDGNISFVFHVTNIKANATEAAVSVPD